MKTTYVSRGQTPGVALKGTLPPFVTWSLAALKASSFLSNGHMCPSASASVGFHNPLRSGHVVSRPAPMQRTCRALTLVSGLGHSALRATTSCCAVGPHGGPGPGRRWGGTLVRRCPGGSPYAQRSSSLAACSHRPTWAPSYQSASAQGPGPEAKRLPDFKQFQRSVPSKCCRLCHIHAGKSTPPPTAYL